MDELSMLRALQAVKDHGTVTAAAGVLRLSPSAVSQQLKRLERATGRALVVPSGRRVALTPEAHSLLDKAGPVADRLVSLLGVPGHGDARVVGHVRIAAFTTAIRHGALDAIANVQHEHERLTCSLSEMDPTEANHALAAGTVDVAVIHYWHGQSPPTHPAIITTHVVDDVADVLCHRDSPLADTPAIADLVNYSWVTTGSGTICHSWLVQMMSGHGLRLRVAMEISDFSLHLTFVAAGLGLALVPRLGRPELGYDIRSIDLARRPARAVQIAIRRGQENDPAILAVAHALQSRLARK